MTAHYATAIYFFIALMVVLAASCFVNAALAGRRLRALDENLSAPTPHPDQVEAP